MLNKLPFAPTVGGLFGVVAAILVIATPGFLFERAIVGFGLPSLLAAATPPLGAKAQILAAIVAALLTAALVGGAIAAVEAAMRRKNGGSVAEAEPELLDVLPSRRPIFAGSDLGAPFMSDEAIAVARDELVLETPYVEAEEAAANETIEPAEPLARPQRPAAEDSIADLMQRLEAAVERRKQRTGDAAPLPGDLTSLRRALGLAANG